ncbi:hypothetical protein RHMOL_Rhmol03G0146400 [Rhododendron molle]|uniref:Uncharacterized protein n=1 Tax=Rhododendron molle TaxID=49168 RepID=A0ACC0PFL4_RHOML|nr:hypothetical protein RHMOL_Rhmol03G0146400 [Rhododendron molle]
MLQAFEEFRACKQERTQLLHSQTQSLSKIEAYADQIEIVMNGWEENTLSNIEEIVDTRYEEDTWEEEDIEQVVDTRYGEDAWDVGESITIFEDSRIEEVVLSKESVDCSPLGLSSTFKTMSSDQMLNLQLQVLPQETMYVPLDPVETFTMVTPLHVTQTHGKRVDGECQDFQSKVEWDFVLGCDPLIPTHRMSTMTLLVKDTFPWYADHVHVLGDRARYSEYWKKEDLMEDWAEV